MSMPISSPHQANRSIRPFLAGLLPDSEQALAALGRQFGCLGEESVRPARSRRRGRCRRRSASPPGVSVQRPRRWPSRFEPLSDDQVGQLLAAVVDEYRDGRPHPDTAQRFSLAGAQPKIALHRGPTGWARPLGSTPTTRILKPTPGTYRRLDLVEHLTMRAATHLGLTVAGSELAQFGGIPSSPLGTTAGRWPGAGCVSTRKILVNHCWCRRTRSTSTVTGARGLGPSQPCCEASRSGLTERRRLKPFSGG